MLDAEGLQRNNTLHVFVQNKLLDGKLFVVWFKYSVETVLHVINLLILIFFFDALKLFLVSKKYFQSAALNKFLRLLVIKNKKTHILEIYQKIV